MNTFLSIIIYLAALSVLFQGRSTTGVESYSQSKSSSSSSSSSSSEESESAEQWDLLSSSYSAAESCFLQGKFLAKDGKCLPCSRCGQELYIREVCSSERDTVCGWCFTRFPEMNEDFHAKCDNLIEIHRTTHRKLVLGTDSDSNNGEFEDVSSTAKSFSILSAVSIDSNNWWKLEIIMEVCFYLALIALIFSVIRFLSKNKPYYRTVHVSAPILNEAEEKDIIHAAESIRNKLGKKGYERLEEFI